MTTTRGTAAARGGAVLSPGGAAAVDVERRCREVASRDGLAAVVTRTEADNFARVSASWACLHTIARSNAVRPLSSCAVRLHIHNNNNSSVNSVQGSPCSRVGHKARSPAASVSQRHRARHFALHAAHVQRSLFGRRCSVGISVACQQCSNHARLAREARHVQRQPGQFNTTTHEHHQTRMMHAVQSSTFPQSYQPMAFLCAFQPANDRIRQRTTFKRSFSQIAFMPERPHSTCNGVLLLSSKIRASDGTSCSSRRICSGGDGHNHAQLRISAG